MQIKQDMPILLNYGCLSNDIFLLDYGFVIPSNPHDHVELKYDESLLGATSLAAGISCSSFVSPVDWQQEMLSRLNLWGDQAFRKVLLSTHCRILQFKSQSSNIFLVISSSRYLQVFLNNIWILRRL